MTGIIADANIEGYVDYLVALMKSEPWQIFWGDLGLKYVHFRDIGPAEDAADSVVWEMCQIEGLILVPDNRNRKGQYSLDVAIQKQNTPASLPVFTIANIPHLRSSRAYADRVIERMLDFLQRIDDLRGTGRLFVP